MEEAVKLMYTTIARFKTFEANLKKCSSVNRTKGYLQGRLVGINSLWDEACKLNDKIVSLKTAENGQIEYFEKGYFAQLEENYFLVLGSIHEMLNSFDPKQKGNGSNQSIPPKNPLNPESNVKLPKISLPEFSGSYHTWLSFKNRFTTLIHSNKNLTNVEKMDYLKSCTKDEAERTIRRYQITDQNYELAWQRLNAKYDNQRVLQVTHIEMLIDRKAVKNESAAELRELIDEMQDCLEALQNLNVNVKTWDPMLIVLLTRKLPYETRALWEQTLKPTDVPTYAELSEFLEQRYRNLECLELVGQSDSTTQHFKKVKHNENGNPKNGNYKFNCVVCNNSNHSLTICEKFLSMPVANRNAIVNAKRMCKNCLANSHILPECKSQKSCFKCGRKHHTMLHREEFYNTQSSHPDINTQEKLTKRSFLSQAAKLFDPLGWLAPVVVKPKIMFQSLWKENVKCDDELSTEMTAEWREFREKLNCLEKIRITRWLGYMSSGFSIELHGFSDASTKAYGAVIYIKSTDGNGKSQVNLVIAKSRVAPVQTVRLPRLELCGGVLLANLIQTTSKEMKIEKSYCWTDSSITLRWVDSSPDKLKTFVANRISEIQSITDVKNWRHVDTSQNPADCLSRGINADELQSHELWWHGPKWLLKSKESWPKNPNVKIPEDQLELKNKIQPVFVTRANTFQANLMGRFSSFQKLAQVTARIRKLFSKSSPKSKAVLVSEVESEKIFWIKLAQQSFFHMEIKALKVKKPLENKSKLLRLNPFLDKNGILRVGGRLKEALIDYDSKHQLIIPNKSQIAKLIINDAHQKTLHGGAQLTTTYTRTKYWIIDARNTIKYQISKCVTCHRYSKRVQEQLMGTLPEPRVNMSRAFLHTGIDYAGPIEILSLRRPGKRHVTKGYIAVFVCFCTKAIHLELVSDMTSIAFLASFKRFCSRRGLPSNMYSDNAKTFIGAKNELEDWYKTIKEELEPQLAEIVIKDSVEWTFIPPSAPHHGGLWEAGVKSMKFHFKRMLGLSVHTYEEIYTMLVEIEGVLNSRPLCPLTNDPDDLSALTPGHFLIGSNLLAPPRPSLLDINTNRLSKWNEVSQRVEHFTKRWKSEYLSRLQNRNKWMRQCTNVKIGDLVLIKEDDLPPSKWLMGRVIEVYKDEDGLVRKVNVKTATTTLFRPITKISILPIDEVVEETPSK